VKRQFLHKEVKKVVWPDIPKPKIIINDMMDRRNDGFSGGSSSGKSSGGITYTEYQQLIASSTIQEASDDNEALVYTDFSIAKTESSRIVSTSGESAGMLKNSIAGGTSGGGTSVANSGTTSGILTSGSSKFANTSSGVSTWNSGTHGEKRNSIPTSMSSMGTPKKHKNQHVVFKVPKSVCNEEGKDYPSLGNNFILGMSEAENSSHGYGMYATEESENYVKSGTLSQQRTWSEMDLNTLIPKLGLEGKDYVCADNFVTKIGKHDQDQDGYVGSSAWSAQKQAQNYDGHVPYSFMTDMHMHTNTQCYADQTKKFQPETLRTKIISVISL
jgi:hypothetical protein